MSISSLANGVSLIAATLTTAAFVPQAVKTLRSRDTHGLSLPMYLLFTLGVLFWMVFGWMISAWPVVIANLITAVLAGAVLWVKWANLNRPDSGERW